MRALEIVSIYQENQAKLMPFERALNKIYLHQELVSIHLVTIKIVNKKKFYD